MQRFADIWRDHIDARHVETDDLGDTLKQKDVFRMDLIGAIDRGATGRNIRGRFEMQDLPFFELGIQRVTGLGDTSRCLVVNVYLRQDIFVAIAAPRVVVRLVDKLLDRALAVTDNMSRNALGNRDKAIVYDQSTKIGADKLLFDDYPT